MEAPRVPQQREEYPPFDLKKYTSAGEYPRVPVEAYSTEGQITDIAPGFSKFVFDYTVMRDTVTKGIMIDTTDYVPEDQVAANRIAILRIDQKIGAKAISGYVVDLRYKWPYTDDRLDEEGYISPYKQRRYRPEPALGIIVMNRMMNQPEYIGIPEAEDAAAQLRKFVDDAREARLREQNELIAEHGGY